MKILKPFLSIIIIFNLIFLVCCGGGGSNNSTTATSSEEESNIPDDEETNSNTISAEKFTPPTGACSNIADPDSPCPRRLLMATSTDGITFTRSNKVISDQANTPNILVLPSGRILVYYTGSNLNVSNPSAPEDAIAAAVSDDNGDSWTYYKASFTGFGDGAPIVDPDIIALDDGTFRMFITRGIQDGDTTRIGILWADSADGFNFTYGGISAMNGERVIDSLTYKIGSSYHMYVLNPDGEGKFAYFTSTDGKSFEFSSESKHEFGSDAYILSNWFKISDTSYKIFAFGFPNADIRSFTTSDGTNLTGTDDIHLKFADDDTGLEKTWIKDAAVAKLNNGSYIMIYVSEIP